jgi:hypothetical protein
MDFRRDVWVAEWSIQPIHKWRRILETLADFEDDRVQNGRIPLVGQEQSAHFPSASADTLFEPLDTCLEKYAVRVHFLGSKRPCGRRIFRAFWGIFPNRAIYSRRCQELDDALERRR